VEFLLVEYFGGTCVEIDEEKDLKLKNYEGWPEPRALKTVTSGATII
jgi:hypothetical protein